MKCDETEKYQLPRHLKLLDKGFYDGLQYPRQALIHFMRKSDGLFRELTSEEQQLRFGNSVY